MTQRFAQQAVDPSTLATMHANLASMAALSSRLSEGRLSTESGARSATAGVMAARAETILDLKMHAVALHGALRTTARVLQPTLMDFLR